MNLQSDMRVKAEVQFKLSRVALVEMHYAVDRLVIFCSLDPDPGGETGQGPPNSILDPHTVSLDCIWEREIFFILSFLPFSCFTFKNVFGAW